MVFFFLFLFGVREGRKKGEEIYFGCVFVICRMDRTGERIFGFGFFIYIYIYIFF